MFFLQSERFFLADTLTPACLHCGTLHLDWINTKGMNTRRVIKHLLNM